MKKKAVFIMALFMAFTAAGCEKKSAGSESGHEAALVVAEAPAPEEKPAPEGTVRYGAFEYSVADGLSADPVTENVYYLKGRDDVSFTVYEEQLMTGCTAECYNDFMCSAVLPEGMSTGEMTELGGKAVSVITVDMTKAGMEDGCRTSYTIVSEDEAFSVTAFYKSADEETALEKAREIVENAVYVGRENEDPPAKESELFTADLDEKWRCQNGVDGELTVKYAMAEDIAHYASYLSVQPADMTGYEASEEDSDTAEAYAKKRYEEMVDGPFASIYGSVEGITETELFGLKCYKITSAIQNFTYGDCLYELYVFEKDGRVMEINIRAYRYEGYETVLDELRGIIERIGLK